MDMIYTFEEIDTLMDSIDNYNIRSSFIQRYINDLAEKNEDNNENYKLFSTGVITNGNDIRLENEITGTMDFFKFTNKSGNQTYITSTFENCNKIRNMMNTILLYL